MNHYMTREVVSVDVPDCDKLISKFVYNYFVNDEAVNDSGLPGIGFGGVSYETQSDIDRRTLKRSVPRHVILEVKGVKKGDYTWASHEIKKFDLRNNDIIRQKIQSEFSVSTPDMSLISIEDTNILNRLKNLIDETAKKILPDIDIFTAQLSQTDIANIVNNATSPDVSGKLLLEILVNNDDSGIVYVNNDNSKIENKSILRDSNIRFDIQVHDKFVADISNSLVYNPFSMSQTNILKNTQLLKSRQEGIRQNSHTEILDEDYEPELLPITQPRRTNQVNRTPRMGSCGYIIDKYEIKSNGTKQFIDSLLMDDVNIKQLIDTKIKYGSTYTYVASSLNLLELIVDLDNNSDNISEKVPYIVRCLIRSRPTLQTMIKCIETIPPTPPDGIFYTYDYDQRALVINWQCPVTSQRDVKKFQIFRRKNINEPFYLLRQYDFNDSLVKFRNTEDVDDSLNIQMDGAYTSFIDHEFNASGDFIYTVVAIDAHNLTSNYGAQSRVKFNNATNKIEIQNISPPGAPKQFPNFYVSSTQAQNINDVRFTEDVIRDSNHSKIRLYFDPEFLTIKDSLDNDQKLLTTTNDRGHYKFQILNLDRQKMNILRVDLQDLRIV